MKMLLFAKSKICVTMGITDLKIDKPVFDIELGERLK